jgi:metal-responsive CopG/Arc/MetJ family transcriptional regulator
LGEAGRVIWHGNVQQESIDMGMVMSHTYGMKTAISIPDELFRLVDDVAKKQNRSRSDVFAVATKEYLERLQSKAVLDSLNEVYSVAEAPEDVETRRKATSHLKKHIIKGTY